MEERGFKGSYQPGDRQGFALMLYKYRHKKGISQKKAAELLEIPQKTYEDWERGKHVPKGKELFLRAFQDALAALDDA
jgi:transcriptional regulator with XRE-family HTH domain